MAYYLYTPETAGLQRENIEIVGESWTDVESERHALVNQAMNAVSRGETVTADAVLLHRADHRRLPVGLVSRLMDPDYYNASIMESKFGLAMYAPREEGTPNFALLSEEIDDDQQLRELGEDGVDVDTFNHLFERRSITHDALQLEPISNNGRLSIREHKSFGYIGVGGNYQPVVTVLSEEHPLRQAIAPNQTAG